MFITPFLPETLPFDEFSGAVPSPTGYEGTADSPFPVVGPEVAEFDELFD